MRLDRYFVAVVLPLLVLVASPRTLAESEGGAVLEMQAPSLRSAERLQDASGTFELTLELDPLAGETLVSQDFTIVLGASAPPPPAADALFNDSFESN